MDLFFSIVNIVAKSRAHSLSKATLETRKACDSPVSRSSRRKKRALRPYLKPRINLEINGVPFDVAHTLCAEPRSST